MLLRRFEETDAKDVSALIIRTLMISNTKDYSLESMTELAARQQPEHILERAGRTHFYVAVEDGRIVGCGGISPVGEAEDECSLLNIFVLPEFQGRGIGRRIVETLEEDVYARQKSRIGLSASVTGLAFYQRLSYDFRDGCTQPDETMLYKMVKETRSGSQ